MSFDALEPTNRGLTPAWRSSQVSTSPLRRWASPGCLLSPPTLLEARHHAGPRTQFTVTEWQVSDRVYILPGEYYILNTDFILHSLVCVAIDANNRNMDIMVFICCQASHLVRSVPIITNVSLQLLTSTSRLWAATGTEGDTADTRYCRILSMAPSTTLDSRWWQNRF